MGMQERTITRRLNDSFGELQNEFSRLCCKEDFETKWSALERAVGQSDYPSKLRDLLDMLNDCGIEYEYRRDYEYYKGLVESSDIPDFAQLEQNVVTSLYKKYKDAPSPEKYMERIVNSLCKKEDNWESDTLRVRILKQFIKYGNCLSYKAERKGKSTTINIYCGKAYIKKYLKAKDKNYTTMVDSLKYLDDKIFDVLEGATKEQKKHDGTYGILKMVDDLASGKFRTGGQTQKSIYLFAMVYDMSFYSKSSKMIDYKTDIEVNLFRDYYCNNFVRFISDAYRDKMSEYDLDPSGRGINYKNFAEMVYLYYISKSCDASEKIIASNEMIQEILAKAPEYNNCQSADETESENNTVYYRNLVKKSDKNIYCEDILDLDENEFKEFLLRNFNCDLSESLNSINEMQLAAEQKTAERVYEEVLEKLNGKVGNLKECRYGLWFADIEMFRRTQEENPGHQTEEYNDFIELLVSVNDYVKDKVKEFSASERKSVTRTSILVAYYCYYNKLHEYDESEKLMSFQGLLEDFRSGVDEELEKAMYQHFSEKNLFDVLIAFSAYAYHNF